MSSTNFCQIELSDAAINYTLRTSNRARNLRLTINLDGELVVTKPWLVSTRQVERFMQQKAGWILKKMTAIKTRGNNSLLANVGAADYLKYKEQARALAIQKVTDFGQIYGLGYNRIFIRNQKTRWGSCSAQKNLNYNFRIALLPERLVDYIIVHELCHLQELNHSQRFWALVGQEIPYYKEARKELRNI
ncbi:M48 family metallopeptidase [Patescibacteria group bacterium]|nr:M48 family metallopeptidase [Patescibacteria group bacterium]